MKVVVGLGNPGVAYERTLHNVGFDCVDCFSREEAADGFLHKFGALFYKGFVQGHPYILLKPQTFMNLSGKSVVLATRFYKVAPEDVLVVFDDLDLQPGVMRYRQGGGGGGHKGVIDIIQRLGSPNFHRLKIGIGRPEHKAQVSAYVLGRGDAQTAERVEQAITESSQHLRRFIAGGTIGIGTKAAGGTAPKARHTGAI